MWWSDKYINNILINTLANIAYIEHLCLYYFLKGNLSNDQIIQLTKKG